MTGERSMRVLGALSGVLLAAAVGLGGCATGSGGDPAPPQSASDAPDTSPDPATVAPDESEEAADSDDGAGGTDAGVAVQDQDPVSDDELVAGPCRDEQFRLAVEPLPDESGAGSFGFRLVFTNVSVDPCTFDGRPGLIAIDAAGDEVGGPAGGDASDSSLVVVAAGGTASAHVRASQAGAHDCTPVDASGLRARLTSDGAGDGIDADYAITVCDGRISTMTVSPLVAG